MRCPFCTSTETRVIDSRPADDGLALRRRRLCEGCGGRFTTHERYHNVPLMVVKKDGRREEFSSPKLLRGMASACNKRPVATADLALVAQTVEASLRSETAAEVSSERIGEMVMERLFALDEVAFVRFASVYQRFDDVRRFAQLLERMSRRGRARSASRHGAPTELDAAPNLFTQDLKGAAPGAKGFEADPSHSPGGKAAAVGGSLPKTARPPQRESQELPAEPAEPPDRDFVRGSEPVSQRDFGEGNLFGPDAPALHPELPAPSSGTASAPSSGTASAPSSGTADAPGPIGSDRSNSHRHKS